MLRSYISNPHAASLSFNYTVTTTSANSQSSNHLVLFCLVASLTCQSEAVAWSLMMSKSRPDLNGRCDTLVVNAVGVKAMQK